MGADNWAICPKCRLDAVKAKEKRQKKAETAYGKKPVDEYLVLRAEAEKPLEIEATLRENYGLGVGIDGEFGVSYRSSCSTCGFKFEYTHSETAIQIPDEYAYEAAKDDPYGKNYRQ